MAESRGSGAVQVHVNKEHIENLVEKVNTIDSKITSFRQTFHEFRNALLTGLLGFVGVLITALVTVLILLI